MPKGKNQKLKLYYLSRIMIEKTDEEHYLTISEIRDELLKYEVTADRKSLYDDIEALSVLGIEVMKERMGSSIGYHVINKQFEIAELKLLVDAIQSSKFITERKSKELIKKLMDFSSKYEAEQLRRQVVVSGRIKSMNESIYYNVDEVHEAIAKNKQIRFEYLNWNLEKRLEPRRDRPYIVSPWALTWDDENYYMISYDSEAQKIKHFRVDKMRDISVLTARREGREQFKGFDLASFSKKSFGMFGGQERSVQLEFEKEMVGVIIDRFGKDITIRPVDLTHSTVYVDVVVSNQFFGWVFALGGKVRIVGPKDIEDRYYEMLRSQYQNNNEEGR